MNEALVSTTQHREGYKVITDMVFDLGAADAGLKSQSILAADPIGTTAGAAYPSYLCKLTPSVFGIVTTVDTICLEQMSDGTMTDFDLMFGDDDGWLGKDATSDSLLASAASSNIAAFVGGHITSTVDDNSLANKYLYVTAGTPSTKRAACTITVTDVVIGNLVSGMNAIQLMLNDGVTPVKFVFDSSIAWDNASPGANKIGFGSSGGSGGACDTAKKLTYAISQAINNHSSAGTIFSTDATSRDKSGGSNTATTNLTVITLTRSVTPAATITENSVNTLVDGYVASGIEIENFAGGMPNDITAGKFLIRVTGFMEPEDLV